MSRTAAMFGRLRANRECALGAFLMLGDPGLQRSARLLDDVVAGGADFVEVGIPFSDPVADGPVIQAAASRALEAGVRTGDCFALIAAFRERHPDVPVGILTYANLVIARGRGGFFGRAAEAGADSLLVADLPAREAQPWVEEMLDAGIEPVLIAAGNTPPQTLWEVAKLSHAYTYCVTRAGVTGADGRPEFDQDLVRRLARVGAPPPVFGFGIATADHVRAAVAAGAAGVISGSAIVAAAAEGRDVATLVADLKSGTRNESGAH